MRQLRVAALRHKRAVLTLFMCAIALCAGATSKLFALVHPDYAKCCGGGECVAAGQCYPGSGNTGSICGSDGYWSVGCTGN